MFARTPEISILNGGCKRMEKLIEMRTITKVYPNGVVANYKVDFEVNCGEIHALVGENGAGKSTLMKILCGFVEPDSGEIFYKSKKVNINTPLKALEMGIGMVHQHFMLVPTLTVAENIVLGMEPKKGLSFDMRKAISITRNISSKYNLSVNPESRVKDISVGMKQKVEILKILLRGVEVIILDEPTAVLTPQETKKLFESLNELKKQGYSIIFITHKLKEVKQISDRITIMRKGEVIATVSTDEVSEKEISQMMIDKNLTANLIKPKNNFGEVVLKVNNLSTKDENGREILKNISFQIREGEILGVAGVEGNGQNELVEVLAGLRKIKTGNVFVKEIEVTNKSPKFIRNEKVSHIPEDRMKYGVADEASVQDNLISNRYDKPEFNKFLSLDLKKIRDEAERLVEEFDIKVDSVKSKVKSLSGGNVQKIVIARELSSNPSILLANQPTRGVDIGAMEFIHRRLVEMKEQSTAILLVSSDIDEILKLSDRLIVMYEGEIVAKFSEVSQITPEELGLYMLGIKKQG